MTTTTTPARAVDPRDRPYQMDLDLLAGMAPYAFCCTHPGCRHDRVADGLCHTHQPAAVAVGATVGGGR